MSLGVIAKNKKKRITGCASRRDILTLGELKNDGIRGATLSRLVKNGEFVRLARGIYTTKGTETSSRFSLVLVTKRIPNGVICLLSALEYYGLTTQIPHEVWILIHGKAWRSSVAYPPIRLVYSSEKSFKEGIASHCIDGQTVRMTTPARTVADCFKYRSKVGLDVAIEALRDFRRKRVGSMDDLWKAAKLDRVTRVIRPYLESVT